MRCFLRTIATRIAKHLAEPCVTVRQMYTTYVCFSKKHNEHSRLRSKQNTIYNTRLFSSGCNDVIALPHKRRLFIEHEHMDGRTDNTMFFGSTRR